MAGEFKQVSVQSLECPVCLNIFSDPKILSCSHTYCKACLERLIECHGNDQKLICPVCRAETQVPNKDITQLQTSLALKSLVDDVKNQHQYCTHCKLEEKPQAVVYCQDCGKYLCITCQTKHSQWEDFNDHGVLAVSEITSGKVLIRRYRKCKKHPKEVEECFCCDCRRFACFRCVVMEHKDERHRVIDPSVYESDHLKSVQELKSKADKKRSRFQLYVDFVDQQKGRVSNAKEQCINDINKAYEESVRQLAEKRELLIGEVKGRTEGVERELDEMKKSAQQQIAHVTTITDLVTNGTKIPVEMDSLAAHDTLCQELQEALRQEDPDYKQSRHSSKKGKCVAFERNVGTDELGLGKIVNSVGKNIELPTKDSMNAMIPTPDGRMAVGCHEGGINIFSADGHLEQTLLKNTTIIGVGFLSDGRCVIQNGSNITLYTTKYEKLDVMFETLRMDGGSDCLTVDSEDQIYIGNSEAEKMQVFSPAGGKAIREIQCDGYQPMQLVSLNPKLLITISGNDTISAVDNDGVVKYKLKDPSGNYLHATVTNDNTILVACVKHEEGLVSIDEYTTELKHIKSLITDYKIEKPNKRNWYCLQEFRSGEIAFCTPDRLYIFH